MWAQASLSRGPNPEWTVRSCPWASEIRSLQECGWQTGCQDCPNSPPRRCRLSMPPDTSVGPVLSLFVLFILLLVGTLGTEPLHFFRWCSHYSNTGPVIPVVTVVTTDHGTPIVGLVASGTDPDLIPPLISDHVSADGLRDHTSDRGFGRSGSRDGWGRGRHQSRGRGGLREEWRRHRGGGDMHGDRGRDCSRRWGLRSTQRRGRLSFRGWDHFADDDLVLASPNSESGRDWKKRNLWMPEKHLE